MHFQETAIDQVAAAAGIARQKQYLASIKTNPAPQAR
jgi:hypothetical protein